MSEFYYKKQIRDAFSIPENRLDNYADDLNDEEFMIESFKKPAVLILDESCITLELEIFFKNKNFRFDLVVSRDLVVDDVKTLISSDFDVNDALEIALKKEAYRQSIKKGKFKDRFLITFSEMGESCVSLAFDSIEDTLADLMTRLNNP